MPPRLALSRRQVLAFRRRAGSLDERLPPGAASLRRAAWAGLQDSMPRAAQLSIHARVEGATPAAWEHPSLTQIWGPRFSNYVVAAQDLAVFSLGRLADRGPRGDRARHTAARLHALLDGRRMPCGEAERALGLRPNMLRYAALTGTVLLRWDGARQPIVWTAPPPSMEAGHARHELARRYLHVFAPATAPSFAHWAGIHPAEAHTAFAALADELTPVRTPLGDASIRAADEPAFLAEPGPAAPARLLPSGDAYFLLWGADRDLLVPETHRRDALWTARVWPGALLVGGEIVGTWRRAAADVSLDAWRPLPPAERDAVEAEAAALPLPGLDRPLALRWT